MRADNVASQRVAERCGFTREAMLRSHIPFKGGRRDTVVFSLLPGGTSPARRVALENRTERSSAVRGRLNRPPLGNTAADVCA